MQIGAPPAAFNCAYHAAGVTVNSQGTCRNASERPLDVKSAQITSAAIICDNGGAPTADRIRLATTRTENVVATGPSVTGRS